MSIFQKLRNWWRGSEFSSVKEALCKRVLPNIKNKRSGVRRRLAQLYDISKGKKAVVKVVVLPFIEKPVEIKETECFQPSPDSQEKTEKNPTTHLTREPKANILITQLNKMMAEEDKKMNSNQ